MEFETLLGVIDLWNRLDNEEQDTIERIARASAVGEPFIKLVPFILEPRDLEGVRDFLEYVAGTAAREKDEKLERDLDDILYRLGEYGREI